MIINANVNLIIRIVEKVYFKKEEGEKAFISSIKS